VQQHAPQTETELKVLYEACGRAGEACVRPRPAHGRGDVVFAEAAARGAQDSGPALRLDLPAAAAAAGGPTALLGRRPAPKRPAGGRASARGSARCAAAPFGVARRVAGRCGSRRLITPGSVRAPG